MNNPRLQDKVIVVIGGTSGMGLSASKALIEHNARVVALGKSPESTESARALLGSSAWIITADATRPGATEKAISAALKQYGRCDGLFHVAGGSGNSILRAGRSPCQTG